MLSPRWVSLRYVAAFRCDQIRAARHWYELPTSIVAKTLVQGDFAAMAHVDVTARPAHDAR